MTYEYVDRNREGDHVCYITDLSRVRSDFPRWEITRSLDDILTEIVHAWSVRLSS
jgi:CDP-paratose 2-epimerase